MHNVRSAAEAHHEEEEQADANKPENRQAVHTTICSVPPNRLIEDPERPRSSSTFSHRQSKS
jgi:hypothetical protein